MRYQQDQECTQFSNSVDILTGQYHQSVLPNQVREILSGCGIKSKVFLDATLGDGGYSLDILKLGGEIVGIDVDPDALSRSQARFQDEGIKKDRFELIQGNFRDIDVLLGDKKFSGAIMDLGVSNLQLADAKRGFSFLKNGPLDMRMDPNLTVSAIDLVKALNKGELTELFIKLGEERFAKQIAEEIIFKRDTGLISTTDLARLIEDVYRRYRVEKSRISPATKVFQAIRIAVNDELNALKEGLEKILHILLPGGVLIVISFHSLEDRIVKETFLKWLSEERGKLYNNKVIIADDEELFANQKSRSAKMRVFIKND